MWQTVSSVQTHKHQDPLFRFFEREVKMGGKMLQEVRQDLSDVVQVCEGKKKQTNYLRTLISDLVKGTMSHFHCLFSVLYIVCKSNDKSRELTSHLKFIMTVIESHLAH